MTNKQVLDLAEGLPFVDVPDMTGAFNYAVDANLIEAQRIAPSINKAIKPSEAMEEYEKKYVKLMEEHSNKDKDGKVISTDHRIGNKIMTHYDIPGIGDPESKYSKAHEKQKEENKDVIKAHEVKLEFLDKKNGGFKPVMIHVSEIPKGLSREQSKTIFVLVDKK